MTSRPAAYEPFPDRPMSLLESATRLNISMLINRAHLAINYSQYEAARKLLTEAIDLASELPEPEITQARCYFWEGVIADRTGRADLAPQLFVAAIPCLHCSREGERLLSYIHKYIDQVSLRMETLERENKANSSTIQQWKSALQDVQEGQNSEYAPLNVMLPKSPTSPRHSLPSPRTASLDDEDEEAELDRLVGQEDDFNTHVFHHEVKAGSESRAKSVPGSTVPHSLPENGLMKAIPLGSLQASSLTQMDSSGNTKDRPSMLPSPELGPVQDFQREDISRPNTIRRLSSMRTGLMKRLSTRLSTPFNTLKQEPGSEPETPSPLRKASLPGDDMAKEQNANGTI